MGKKNYVTKAGSSFRTAISSQRESIVSKLIFRIGI